MKFAPATLRQLPSTIEANQEKKGRLQVRDQSKGTIVEACQFVHKCVHGELGFMNHAKVSMRLRTFLRRAEPAQGRPVLEPLGDLLQLNLGWRASLSKGDADRLPQCLAFLDRCQQRKFRSPSP